MTDTLVTPLPDHDDERDGEIDAVLRHLRISGEDAGARARAAYMLTPDEIGPFGPKWPSPDDGTLYDTLQVFVRDGEWAALAYGLKTINESLGGLVESTKRLERTVDEINRRMGAAA